MAQVEESGERGSAPRERGRVALASAIIERLRPCGWAGVPIGGSTRPMGGNVPDGALYYPSKLKSQVKDSCPEAQCPPVQSRHGPPKRVMGIPTILKS